MDLTGRSDYLQAKADQKTLSGSRRGSLAYRLADIWRSFALLLLLAANCCPEVIAAESADGPPPRLTIPRFLVVAFAAALSGAVAWLSRASGLKTLTAEQYGRLPWTSRADFWYKVLLLAVIVLPPAALVLLVPFTRRSLFQHPFHDGMSYELGWWLKAPVGAAFACGGVGLTYAWALIIDHNW